MAARAPRTIAIVAAFAFSWLGTAQSALASPSDCNDMTTEVAKLQTELAKKDSDPSRANSLVGAFNNEAKLCLDDNNSDKVPDALAKELEGAAKSSKEVFSNWQKTSATWLKEAVAVFKWSCAEIKKVEDTLCGVESEPNETPNYSAAKGLAATMERNALTKIDLLVKRFSELAKTKKELVEDTSLRSKVEAIYAPMKDSNSKLRGAQRNQVLAGARHPFTKYAIEYGKQKHRTMGTCTVRDKTLPTGSTRPDCFQPRNCLVIEFKPRGDRKGSGQVAGYVSKLQTWYTKKVQSRTLGKAPWGSKDIMKDITSKCANSSGQVTLRGQVKFYDRCTSRYKCIK